MLNEIYTNTFNLSQPIPLSKQFAMRVIDRNRQNGYAIISASMAESDANHPHQKEKLAELNQQENSNEGINFQAPRDLLFAIPNSEITMSNGTIKQNEGYN